MCQAGVSGEAMRAVLSDDESRLAVEGADYEDAAEGDVAEEIDDDESGLEHW